MLMQRLQHQSVAAERHHSVGAFGIVIAIEFGELGECLLGLGACACDHGDPGLSLGGGHGIAGSSGALKGTGARKVVYTTLAGLVEIANSREVAGSGAACAPWLLAAVLSHNLT